MNYRATFSNGIKIAPRDGRRAYTHAWYAAGIHRLNSRPWSFQGFSSSAEVAKQRMLTVIGFAHPDHVAFAEVVAVDDALTSRDVLS